MCVSYREGRVTSAGGMYRGPTVSATNETGSITAPCSSGVSPYKPRHTPYICHNTVCILQSSGVVYRRAA